MSRPGGLLALLLGLLLLVLTVCEVQQTEALILKKIRIPLYQRQYVQLKVGIPGRVLTLRLRWDLSTNYLYDSPYSYSNTFGAEGSDLFFLAPDIPPVRLPVVYSQEPSQLLSPHLPYYNGLRQDTSGGVTYNGVLGMGPDSYIWRYWTSYTLSKFTLVMGGFDDVDTLSGGVTISSSTGFETFIHCLGEENGTLPLDFKPEEEFTYIPIRIFPEIYHMLFETKDHRISDNIYPVFANHTRAGEAQLVFWMSSTSSVIMTSFGGPEMALRISEREGKNQSQITLGRIHLLEDFVYFHDKVTGKEIVQEVFDTYPATQENQAAEGFLALLALALWCWWSLEVVSMVYQWTAYGIFPRVRHLCNELRNANVSWISSVKKKYAEQVKKTNSAAGTEKHIGALLFEGKLPGDCTTSPSIRTKEARILNTGPVDWTMLSCILFLTRLICFWTAYLAIFGFKSVRFAEHLAKIAYLDPMWGQVCYYGLLVLVMGIPLVVNTFFIRRYTFAGCVLIQISLLAAVWINRLPETTSLFFSLAVNLIFSSLITIRVFEWLAWCAFRGADSALTANVTDVNEYPSERDLSNTSITTAGRFKDAVSEVQQMTSEALYQIKTDVILPTTSPTVRRKKKHDEEDTTPPDHEVRKEASDKLLLSRMRDRVYTAGDVFLLIIWIFLLVPSVCVWLYVINVLPMIENIFPTHPMRAWMASFYLVIIFICSWSGVCRTFLQILQQGVIDIKESMIELSNSLRVQHELLGEGS